MGQAKPEWAVSARNQLKLQVAGRPSTQPMASRVESGAGEIASCASAMVVAADRQKWWRSADLRRVETAGGWAAISCEMGDQVRTQQTSALVDDADGQDWERRKGMSMAMFHSLDHR